MGFLGKSKYLNKLFNKESSSRNETPMRTSFKLLLFSAIVSSSTLSQVPRGHILDQVDLKQVRLTDGFWQKRIETNRSVTLSHVLEKCYETGRVDNLKVAAGLKEGEYCTVYQFDDSDVFKSIEAVGYSLMMHPDTELETRVDSLIRIIALAQEEDGYLYSPRKAPSARIKNGIGPERWSNLQWSHELYTLGHLYEAAVAYYRATGKRALLDVVLKSADLILRTFHPKGLPIPPGHQEIELGLIKLYEMTGEAKYLNQAKYFLEIRGRGKELTGRNSWGEYAQDHKPVLEQTEAVGHAVRAAYQYTAMTDIAALTADQQYAKAVDVLWGNVTGRKIYVTGGIGSTGHGEALGGDYDLPNASAYNETCSSIAMMMWNFSMYRLRSDGKYLDVFERTLYNAFLSGVGLDGKSFFYPNPLQSYGTHVRSPWFTCACCPPNVARFIASFPSKIYSTNGTNLYVNLFAASEARVTVGKTHVTVRQETRYPWEGNVKVILRPEIPETDFTLFIRIPGWSVGKPIEGDLYRFREVGLSNSGGVPVIRVNGRPVDLKLERGFVAIPRRWKAGDQVEVAFPMDIRRVEANGRVEADRGRIALQRGPVVFCVEGLDTKDGSVRSLQIDDDAPLSTTMDEDLLQGVVTIHGKAVRHAMTDAGRMEKEEQAFRAIPYYAWAHRGPGEMSVWLAREERAVSPLHAPTLVSLSTVTASAGRNPQSMNDQIEPKSSADESIPFFHWWPKKGTTEWVQLDFPNPAEVSGIEVYWFDDTGTGECRVPRSWKVLYKVGDSWVPVYTTDAWGVAKDQYNRVTFETVKTSSLKVEIQSQTDFAAGIHEIKLQ